MYCAISELNLWSNLKFDKPKDGGFMFCDKEWVKLILNHPLVYKYNHSGSSAALCLRHMEYIADHGWINYINHL